MVMTFTAYEKVQKVLINEPKTWLITGVAGFIGSNLAFHFQKNYRFH